MGWGEIYSASILTGSFFIVLAFLSHSSCTSFSKLFHLGEAILFFFVLCPFCSLLFVVSDLIADLKLS